jgi:hypothetical protein
MSLNSCATTKGMKQTRGLTREPLTRAQEDSPTISYKGRTYYASPEYGEKVRKTAARRAELEEEVSQRKRRAVLMVQMDNETRNAWQPQCLLVPVADTEATLQCDAGVRTRCAPVARQDADDARLDQDKWDKCGWDFDFPAMWAHCMTAEATSTMYPHITGVQQEHLRLNAMDVDHQSDHEYAAYTKRCKAHCDELHNMGWAAKQFTDAHVIVDDHNELQSAQELELSLAENYGHYPCDGTNPECGQGYGCVCAYRMLNAVGLGRLQHGCDTVALFVERFLHILAREPACWDATEPRGGRWVKCLRRAGAEQAHTHTQPHAHPQPQPQPRIAEPELSLTVQEEVTVVEAADRRGEYIEEAMSEEAHHEYLRRHGGSAPHAHQGRCSATLTDGAI